MRTSMCMAAILITMLTAGMEKAFAVPVAFQNGTATASQSPTYSPDEVVDGVLAPGNGWAIGLGGPEVIVGQTAVWETVMDVNAGQFGFQLHQVEAGNLLGRFRLSATSDNRSLFADGLDNGGDVTANWTVLTGPVVSGPAGMTFMTLADNSILAGGTVPATGVVYDVQYTGSFLGITGLRLEAIEDPSLPFSGPGLAPNGNFVLTEMVLDASAAAAPVPEPATLVLLGTGLAGLVGYRRRQKRNA